MSYGFTMCFANAETLGDAMVFAKSFISKLGQLDSIMQMVEDKKYWMPSGDILCWENSYQDLQRAKNADDAWLARLCKANFVFWPEQKVMGLVGDRWPNLEDFFPESIYFRKLQ